MTTLAFSSQSSMNPRPLPLTTRDADWSESLVTITVWLCGVCGIIGHLIALAR